MREQAADEAMSPMRWFTDSWVRTNRQLTSSVGHFYRGVAEANRSLLSLSNGEDRSDRRSVDAPKQTSDAPELAYTREGWEMERTVDHWEDLGVGDSVRFTKTVSEEDVQQFAAVSGDTNRLHLDEDFAVETRFGDRIVHGTLVSGLISAALARLPGLTIYLSQDLEFLKPVDIGDRLTAVVEIVEDLGNGRFRLTTEVLDGDGGLVIDGEAVVIIDEPPAE